MSKENIFTIGGVYHVFNKSIAEFKIFNKPLEFSRIIKAICYYQIDKQVVRFSKFLDYLSVKKVKDDFAGYLQCLLKKEKKSVEIIAYCIMPTHIHLILKPLMDNGISVFMNNILNSYTRYFNTKTKRKGPLWESRFKSVLVETDEQLIHLTRYVHLNPVTAYLVDKSQHWNYSSYREFLGITKTEEKICTYSEILNIKNKDYKEFVEAQIDYQRDLAKIKHLLLD